MAFVWWAYLVIVVMCGLGMALDYKFNFRKVKESGLMHRGSVGSTVASCLGAFMGYLTFGLIFRSYPITFFDVVFILLLYSLWIGVARFGALHGQREYRKGTKT